MRVHLTVPISLPYRESRPGDMEDAVKTLLLVSLAGVAAAATPAQAHPTYHYRGGCGFFTVSDGTDSPQTKWDGEIQAVVVATDAVTGAPAPVRIDVDCELRINGATPGTVVFSASGTGVAANAGQFSFHADPDDIVTMCDNVTVGGEFHKECADATTTPVTPDTMPDPFEEVGYIIDQASCSTFASMSGGPADQPPAFDIRSDGDIYIAGEWFWDCPEYGTSGS